jgi:hypothetical protein
MWDNCVKLRHLPVFTTARTLLSVDWIHKEMELLNLVATR